MTKAASGSTLKVHYTGRLKDGTEFDSSKGRDPMEVTLGASQVIPGFEAGLMDMAQGDKKTITIPVDEAYGPLQEDMVQKVPLADLPSDPAPKAGDQLVAHAPDGQQIPLVVTEVGDDYALLDGNHPLAGKALIFDLELVEIS
jgi:FKBP-type peptidyl-prolyl cis-trans isomerase 2